MKTIFAKYNRERLPQFQTVTKIVELKDGSKKVFKHALNSQARGHIAEIFSNYTRLTDKYPDIKLVKPVLENDLTVSFPIVQGVSLDKLLKQALDNEDRETFLALLDKFISYVDSFVDTRQVKFVPCEKFKIVFGDWQSEELQDTISFVNMDLIFSNLFLNEDDTIAQIDYEWVFEFAIPVKLVLFRTLATLLNGFFNNIIPSGYREQIIDFFGMRKSEFSEYIYNESQFYKYVYGAEKKYFLNNNVLKFKTYIFEKLQIKEHELQNKEHELQIKEHELQNKDHELQNKDHELHVILQSKSWKITVAIRKLVIIIKKIFIRNANSKKVHE